ncbi:MAG: Spx/MgsR family RNA polymerase-binding regulatory protein [Verrucomicrobiota bacterium]
MTKLYTYSGCSTCKKAKRFLDKNNITYKELAIRETPPSKTELKKMLKSVHGEIRKLFNTSGQDYRTLNIKDKLPDINENEAIDLLATNGNLIKRPVLISDKGILVGYKEETWKDMLF